MKLPATNEQITLEIIRIKGLTYNPTYIYDWITSEFSAIQLFKEMLDYDCAFGYHKKQWFCSFLSEKESERRIVFADSFCTAICLAYIELKEENMQTPTGTVQASVIRDAANKLAGALSKEPHVLKALVKDVILDLTEADRDNRRNDQSRNRN